MKTFFAAAFCGSCILIFLPSQTAAQQTIFNVPSTDVLDKGKFYGELDAAFKPNNQRDVRRFSSFTPRGVFGGGGGGEVGLNVVGNIQPGADATALVPAIKYRFYQNKKKDAAIVAGTNVYLPVCNRAYNVGSYSYVNASKIFKEKTRRAKQSVRALSVNRSPRPDIFSRACRLPETVTTRVHRAARIWVRLRRN